MTLVTNLAILVLAGFVGFEVISKVPEHAAHAADVGHERDPRDRVLGGLLVLGARRRRHRSTRCILVIAIVFGTINVVGGFLVTDRMLEMFKTQARAAEAGRRGGRHVIAVLATSFLQDPNFIDVLYIVAFILFIYGLRGLTGPAHGGARQPDRRRRHGDRGRRDAARPGRWATGA